MSSCTSRNASARADSAARSAHRRPHLAREGARDVALVLFQRVKEDGEQLLHVVLPERLRLAPAERGGERRRSAWSDEAARRAKRTPSWSGTHVSAAPCRSASNSKEKTFSRTGQHEERLRVEVARQRSGEEADEALLALRTTRRRGHSCGRWSRQSSVERAAREVPRARRRPSRCCEAWPKPARAPRHSTRERAYISTTVAPPLAL